MKFKIPGNGAALVSADGRYLLDAFLCREYNVKLTDKRLKDNDSNTI